MSPPTDTGPRAAKDGCVTFVPGSLTMGAAVAILRRRSIGFDPVESTVEVHDIETVAAFRPDLWDDVPDDATRLELFSEEDSEGAHLRVKVDLFGTQLLWVDARPDVDTIADLVAHPGLITAAVGDADDTFWQSEDNPRHYEYWYQGSWDHLPRTTDEWGDAIVDVSGNPGRWSEVPGFRLWAAQDLWFGAESALMIAYDEIWKALTAGQPEDPMMVVEDGQFPHGGTRRFLQYFSTEKRPTTRSRAARVVVQEFDAAHEEVFQQDYDLSQGHPDLD